MLDVDFTRPNCFDVQARDCEMSRGDALRAEADGERPQRRCFPHRPDQFDYPANAWEECAVCARPLDDGAFQGLNGRLYCPECFSITGRAPKCLGCGVILRYDERDTEHGTCFQCFALEHQADRPEDS